MTDVSIAGIPLPDEVTEEAERIAALRVLNLLDTPREERFDRITRMAQRLLGAPIALISLVDVNRQWFKSCQGLGISETPRSASFCAHAIRSDDIMVVPDSHLDPRFRANPLVTGPPFIRFYAGKPLRSPSGHRMGTLCVIDTVPRTLSDRDAAAITDLAAWAELEFNVVSMSRAVAERNELRDRVERLKDEIISITGHELRTPLTAIRGSLGLLGAGIVGSLDDQGQRLVETATRNTDRLIRLVNDMLDVERLAEGRMPVRSDRIDLADVARSAVEALGAVADDAGVRLEIEGSGPVAVRGDRDRLVQVISNLVDNAVKFSSAGSAVTVSVAAADRIATVRVADQGRGMNPDELEVIFARFAQLDSGARRSRAGSGLGLAIVRGIVEMHGGTVTVESAEGAGSVFTVRLPIEDGGS